MRARASLAHYHAGETLYRACDRGSSLVVVASGEVEIIDSSGEAPSVVVVHGPGQFTGEIARP